MSFFEQLSAVAILVDFFLGVTFGVVGGAVYGSLNEDGKKTLIGTAPDPLSNGARMIYGVYTRDEDGHLRSLLAGGQNPGEERDELWNDDFEAQGKDV